LSPETPPLLADVGSTLTDRDAELIVMIRGKITMWLRRMGHRSAIHNSRRIDRSDLVLHAPAVDDLKSFARR
jgi:hypothetical protein